jgi:hypothetical protein
MLLIMILTFEKPKKLRSTKEHNQMYQSDSDVAGTYVPNMSEEDQKKFKAKYIKGDHERIEIRVLIGGANVNIFVYKEVYWPEWNTDWSKRHKNVKLSMNSGIQLTFEEWEQIQQVVEEAKNILNAPEGSPWKLIMEGVELVQNSKANE